MVQVVHSDRSALEHRARRLTICHHFEGIKETFSDHRRGLAAAQL